MTAVEEVQQAITTLERLRAESTPGPWSVLLRPDGWAAIDARDTYVTDGVGIPDLTAGDANLIVTLHRTIDPMLEVLRGAHRYMTAFGDDANPVVVELARAILTSGGAS